MPQPAHAKTLQTFGMRDEKDVLAVLGPGERRSSSSGSSSPTSWDGRWISPSPARSSTRPSGKARGSTARRSPASSGSRRATSSSSPIPKTFRLLPWDYKGFEEGVRWREAVMFGDILTPGRQALCRRQPGRPQAGRWPAPARSWGSRISSAGRSSSSSSSRRAKSPCRPTSGGYFFSGRHGEIRKEIQLLLHRMGIETEYDHHEAAHSQHEIDLRYSQRPGDGRHGHDLPLHGQEGLPDARPLRDVHAQAHQRPERQRHARPPVALERREEPLLRQERPLSSCPPSPVSTWPES